MIKYIRISILSALGMLSLDNAFAQLGNTNNLLGGNARTITTAVPFLTIAPDARSGAMGDVGVAISPDANSTHWNPAKLTFASYDYAASLSYTPWLGKIINDMFIFYGSGFYKITKEQAVALSMRYFDLGEIIFTENEFDPGTTFNPREFAFQGTYSRKLTENLGMSISAKYIHSNLTGNFANNTVDAKPGSSVSASLGVYYFKDLLLSGKNSNIAFGANISDVGAKIAYSNQDQEDFIPANLRLGTAFTTNLDPYNTITFALDINKLLVPTPPIYVRDENNQLVDADGDGSPDIEKGKNPDRPLLGGTFGSFTDAPDGFSEELQEMMLSFGVEYWYNKLFAARAGYFYEHQNKGNRKYFTVGVGFRYQVFGVDFAYLVPQQQNNPLAETLRFTLHFRADSQDKQDRQISE